MATINEIIAKNTEKLEAIINGNVESVTVAGVVVSRFNALDTKYHFDAGHLLAYGDDLEIEGNFAYLMQDKIMVVSLTLMEE